MNYSLCPDLCVDADVVTAARPHRIRVNTVPIRSVLTVQIYLPTSGRQHEVSALIPSQRVERPHSSPDNEREWFWRARRQREAWRSPTHDLSPLSP